MQPRSLEGRIRGNENVYGKVALYNGLNLFKENTLRLEPILDKAIKNLTEKPIEKKG
jgi:hypothetical protein